jgi:hypothetical protein
VRAGLRVGEGLDEGGMRAGLTAGKGRLWVFGRVRVAVGGT